MDTLKILLLLFCLTQIVGCSSQTTAPEIKSDNVGIPFFPARIIDAQTRYPLLISRDYGETWMNAGLGLPSEIQVSFLEKIGNEIIIATDNMGLFISSKNRSKWNPIGVELPSQKINALHVSDNTIFIGVYRKGIFKSVDGGATWYSLNNNLPNLTVQSIWQLGESLLVGTDAGIFRLFKKEKDWKPTTVKTQVLSIYEYEGMVVAGTSKGTVISSDKGNTWNWIRKEGAVHYTHNIDKRIVELVLTGDLYFSDDWGEHWMESKYAPREGSYVYEIAQVGEYLLISNNYGIHRSVDHGKTWELIFETEAMGFFDFLVIGKDIYGGTRVWDEYRKRKK